MRKPRRGNPDILAAMWARHSMLLLALAGCATEPPATAMNLEGYPPAFREGHADGCASARSPRKRDEARFKSDALYAQGWRDGNSICGSR